jgi:hypothetical protein
METTTTRVGLIRYGSGTDMLTRLDFDSDIDVIEEKMAIDEHGSTLPVAGTRGRFWTDDDDGTIYRDNGSSWVVVGSRVKDAYSEPSASNKVALQLRTISGHAANLFEARSNDGSLINFYIDQNGNFGSRSSKFKVLSNPAANEVVATVTTLGTSEIPFRIVLADGSAKNMVEGKTTSGAVTFFVDSLGQVNTPQIIAGRSNIQSNTTSQATQIIKAASGQTSVLTSWRDTSSNPMAFVDVTGGIYGFRVGTTNSTSINLDTANPGFMVGSGTGDNIAFSNSKIQARTNAAIAPIWINFLGGRVNIGDPANTDAVKLQGLSIESRGPFRATSDASFEANVAVTGSTSTAAFTLNGHKVSVQSSAPTSPTVDDIWIVTGS